MHERSDDAKATWSKKLGLPPILRVALAIGSVSILIDPARFITTDTWFTLVYGREILTRGLPRANEHTVIMHGAPWVDSQWLSHLIFYGIEKKLGFAALVALCVLLFVGALAIVASEATRRGAVEGRAALLTVLGSVIASSVFAVRALVIGEFFYAILVVLLTRQRTWKRDALVAALLVAWSNVHGSVLFGLVTVFIASFVDVVEAWRLRHDHELPRAVLRACAPLPIFLATLVATPYGLDTLHAYRSIVANPLVSAYMSEWTRPSFQDAPLTFLAAAFALAMLWRGRRHLQPLHTALLCLSALMALSSTRHAAFFGITFVLTMPALVDHVVKGNGFSFTAPKSFAYLAHVALVSYLAVFAYSASTLERTLATRYPPNFARTIASRVPRNGAVYASLECSDFLLFHAPELRGRVACDARAELIDEASMLWIADLASAQPSPESLHLLTSYDALCITNEEGRGTIEALAHTPVFNEVTRNEWAHVYLRASTP